MRCLIADDSMAMRALIAGIVQQVMPGCEVVQAASGDEALARLEEGAFDYYTLDYTMPGVDGGQVAARVRERDPAARIALVTANRQAAIQARAAALDARLIPKPDIVEPLAAFFSE